MYRYLFSFAAAVVIQTPTANQQFTIKEDVTKWSILFTPTLQAENGKTFFTYTITPQNGKINIFPSSKSNFICANPTLLSAMPS
jgi:hypothetical protein